MFRDVRLRSIAALTLVMLLMSACGGGGDNPNADPQASPTPVASETVEPAPTESESAEPEPRFTAEVTVTGGKVEGPDVVEVDAGDKVSIAVTADVADHVHVHGYDELVDLEPGKRAVIRFTANIPGVWEVELEDAGKLLFELEVR